jgi:hypothetical protein
MSLNVFVSGIQIIDNKLLLYSLSDCLLLTDRNDVML